MTRFRLRLAIPAAIVATASLGVSACGYHAIPDSQLRAQSAWADLQGQYARRDAVTKTMIELAKASPLVDPVVVKSLSDARDRAAAIKVTPETPTDRTAFLAYQAAQGRVTVALPWFMRAVAADPKLRQDAHFLQLKSQIEGSEVRLRIARGDYNEAARDYNDALRAFSSTLWARTVQSGEKPMQPFAAPAA